MDDFEVVPIGTSNLLRRIQFALEETDGAFRSKKLRACERDLEKLVNGYLGRDLQMGTLRPILPRARDR